MQCIMIRLQSHGIISEVNSLVNDAVISMDVWFMCGHTLVPWLQSTRSDIRPQVKWVVSLIIADGHFNLPQESLCVYMVNILTISSWQGTMWKLCVTVPGKRCSNWFSGISPYSNWYRKQRTLTILHISLAPGQKFIHAPKWCLCSYHISHTLHNLDMNPRPLADQSRTSVSLSIIRICKTFQEADLS